VSREIPFHKIPDPHDVRLQLEVNGEVRQDDNTSLMIFKIPELLEAITDIMTLQAGDLVLSIRPPPTFILSLRIVELTLGFFVAGTPKGVGEIVDGDIVKANLFVGDEMIESMVVKAVNRTHRDGTPW